MVDQARRMMTSNRQMEETIDEYMNGDEEIQEIQSKMTKFLIGLLNAQKGRINLSKNLSTH